MPLGIISQCGPTSCTLHKRPLSPLQFDRGKDIPEHSVEGELPDFF